MAYVLLGNVLKDVSHEKISNFLIGNGFPMFDRICFVNERCRPGVLLNFSETSADVLNLMKLNMNNIELDGKKVSFYVMSLDWQ